MFVLGLLMLSRRIVRYGVPYITRPFPMPITNNCSQRCHALIYVPLRVEVLGINSIDHLLVKARPCYLKICSQAVCEFDLVGKSIFA